MENITMKPSPYLRTQYEDEYGDVRDVTVRNYQKQMIMNLLQMEKFVCADDTGLGKTLSVLSMIGYVWLKEPDYVPIIVTTKSALFQWASEVQKFMQGMSAVVSVGEPHERHAAYREFFEGHDPSRKRLLLLTYDMIMRDSEQSVIKDRDHVASREDKRALAAARLAKREAAAVHKATLAKWQAHFGEEVGYDKSEYMTKVLGGQPLDGLKDPPGWTEDDRRELLGFLAARQALMAAEAEVSRMIQVVTPPKVVPGLPQYLKELQARHPGVRFMLVMDEIHKLKNHRSQFHLKSADIAKVSQRIVGMTATPVQNRLMEFFSLFRIVKPDLFPKITHFQNEFCVMKMQNIGGGRQVPVVVGYRNLDKFVERIEPFYLSRKKYEVAKELPALVSMEVDCELSEMQEELYDIAEASALDDVGDDENESANALKALTAVQQACNAPQLLLDEEGNPWEGPSGKIDKIHEILTEQALGKKVIVFSRFEKMISLIEKSLAGVKWTDEAGVERTGIPCVRVTGKESDPKLRERAKQKFQDPKSGINVVLITTAGSESINLQAAEHIVFTDLPWSWGVYVQLTGRAIRIGSTHTTVVAHHLLARRRGGGTTMDHDVLRALREKKKLADKVAGESLQGGLVLVSDESDIVHDIMALMRQKAASRTGDKAAQLADLNARLKAQGVKKAPAKGHEQGEKAKKPPVKRRVVEAEPIAADLDIDFGDLL